MSSTWTASADSDATQAFAIQQTGSKDEANRLVSVTVAMQVAITPLCIACAQSAG